MIKIVGRIAQMILISYVYSISMNTILVVSLKKKSKGPKS
jgi:hypothetical protein